MSEHPDSFAKVPPIYDVHRTWGQNAMEGPFFEGAIPERDWPEEGACQTFLGYPIASPIGVPAGPLLNSRWIALAAKLGYDVLVYKTIRSEAHPSHPLPNILYAKVDEQLNLNSLPEVVYPRKRIPSAPEQLTITNSFGNPSRGPDFLSYDIHRARAALHPLQVLVVSVFGTESSERTLAEDFAQATRVAVSGGAMAIEANLSCPNVKTGGSLYLDPEAVKEVGQAVVKASKNLPVMIKVGTFPSEEALAATLEAAAQAGVQAVAGINTISVTMLNENEQPALGPDRPTTGLCGNGIRNTALEFVQKASKIISEKKLPLELVGGGGITEAEHFKPFFEAGADVVTTATGMMWDPYLAAKYHQAEKPLPIRA